MSRSVCKMDTFQPVGFGVSKRVSQITVSAIKQMPLLASKVGGCVSLGQGIPSFPTPEFIREAVANELRQNGEIGKYSLQPGVPELKAAIASDLKRRRHTNSIDPDTELFISCGGMEALACAITSVVDREDEVILLSPTYSSHIEQVLFAEGVPVFVPLIEQDGWKIDLAGIRKAITSRTKAILFCNPVNPTGTVIGQSELAELALLVKENGLYLISDEAYDFLVYDQKTHSSMLSFPDIRNQLMVAFSFSKRYCMTGWRVGFLCAPEYLINQVLKVHDAFAICAPTISQYAALAALKATNGVDGPGDESVRQMIGILARRRELICERLDRLSEFFSYVKPQGGYFVFPQIIPEKFVNSVELSLRLLHEAKVITVPGSAFGPTGEGHLRMSFGGTENDINLAFDRIEGWL